MSPNDELIVLLRGDRAAADVVLTIADACHVWDDIVDGDPVSVADADSVFLRLFFDLPRNPFYQQHAAKLLPAFECAVHAWFASRELEKSEDAEDQVIAHVTRYNFADFVSTVVALSCGREYALTHAARIRRLLHEEPLAEFQAEIAGRNT